MVRVITRTIPGYAPGVRIRDMTLADCAAVAKIRVHGWQRAYAGLIPQAYLDAMDVGRDAERRRAYLTADGGPVNLVAEAPDSAVTGWACYGPRRDEDARPGSAELYAIYVDPDRIATGIGGALLAEVTTRARADGFGGMALWVLKENARARRFYERAGFRPDGAEETFEAGGTLVPEVRYVRPLSPPTPSPGIHP
ncbi:GNAT family N-acetyltransferase [Streptomyces sp. wa22]|uniref:GNAT family N-acetyltransferase n=1 Tax=Streptomyces sp. wa22 TaxID=1828244 RepID=UPI0011CA34FB|nr:GNAT family N-acetyltransferase [Streptomyces sp. wa22]TXS18842.1 GNAT family N-acetyltransferase [Streptomyces sp. wa22]